MSSRLQRLVTIISLQNLKLHSHELLNSLLKYSQAIQHIGLQRNYMSIGCIILCNINVSLVESSNETFSNMPISRDINNLISVGCRAQNVIATVSR